MMRPAALALTVTTLLAAHLSAATYETRNFVVDAPTDDIARQIGRAAERYRKEKAVQWLGREMPTWRQPCTIDVTITVSGAGGATTFDYEDGHILGQRMRIEGALPKLLECVLPHEVTHTVFAHRFRCQPPRWADEGGAVLSEAEAERRRQDGIMRRLLRESERNIPLRRLFSLNQYPGDLMAFYVESYSVSSFLVELEGRKTYLDFVADGMVNGWDDAVPRYYRFRDVDELEDAWLRQAAKARAKETVTKPKKLAPMPAVTDSEQAAPPMGGTDVGGRKQRKVGMPPSDGDR